jgi:hypothetical protein
VATLNQREDHPHFGFSQNNTILSTTTTLLQILFKYTPPKRFAKFKQKFHAAISSNTLQAQFSFWHTPF